MNAPETFDEQFIRFLKWIGIVIGLFGTLILSGLALATHYLWPVIQENIGR